MRVGGRAGRANRRGTCEARAARCGERRWAPAGGRAEWARDAAWHHRRGLHVELQLERHVHARCSASRRGACETSEFGGVTAHARGGRQCVYQRLGEELLRGRRVAACRWATGLSAEQTGPLRPLPVRVLRDRSGADARLETASTQRHAREPRSRGGCDTSHGMCSSQTEVSACGARTERQSD
jgi:hypothetical protein